MRLIAATALLAAFPFRTFAADRLEIFFNAALTNETSWAYTSVGYSTTKKAYYLGSAQAEIASPQFPFVVTSVELEVEPTAKCSRSLVLVPGGNAAMPVAIAPAAGERSAVKFEFDASAGVRSFALRVSSTGAGGNVYVFSAVAAGVPFVPAPADVQVCDAYRDRFRASWTNPEGTLANAAEAAKVVEIPVQWRERFDFAGIANAGGNTVAIDVSEVDGRFGGEFLYAPAKSDGIVQIGTTEKRGALTFDGLDAFNGCSLVVSAWRPSTGSGKLLPVMWTSGDETNMLEIVEIDAGKKDYAVPVANVPGEAKLVIGSLLNVKSGRVLIDSIGFAVGSVAAQSETGRVWSAVFQPCGEMTVKGLEPFTDYLFRVRADGEESVSQWSEWIPVRTTGVRYPCDFILRIR